MTKTEIKESQDSLLVLLPTNIRNTKEITRSTKILLGALIFLNGMDKAKENGYIFRSNKQLEEDTNLSNKTILTSISHLINLNFITRSTGNRVEGASTYILNFEAINTFQGCNFKGVKSKENYTYKLHLSDGCKNQITPINYTDNIEEKIDKLTLEISELRNDIKFLKDLIIGEIKSVNQGCNFKGVISNYTTDTDTEKEINNNIINNTTSGPVEENNDIVVEDTTNDNITLDELLSMDNVIEVGDVTLHTFIPTNEKLFIPDVDTTDDITSTDNVDINSNIEVCDCSEQREEQKTNDINENKQQVELRSVNEHTSIAGVDINFDSFQLMDVVVNDNTNNEETIYSNDYINNPPAPHDPQNDNLNDNDDMKEEVIDTNWSVPNANLNNAEFERRIKLINAAIDNYKQTQDEQQRSLVNSHITIIRWMYEKNEITQKQMEWVNKIQSNFEKIINGIYIANKTKRNKAVLSHKNNADNKSISQSDKTQQDANKVANLGCSDSDVKIAEAKEVIESVKSNLTNGTDESELDNIFLPIFQLIQSQRTGDYEVLDYIADGIDEIISIVSDWFSSDKINIIINTAIRLLSNKK